MDYFRQDKIKKMKRKCDSACPSGKSSHFSLYLPFGQVLTTPLSICSKCDRRDFWAFVIPRGEHEENPGLKIGNLISYQARRRSHPWCNYSYG